MTSSLPVVCLCVSGSESACMRRQGQGELVSFDSKPERTTIRLRREKREAQVRHQATMKNQEEQHQGHERNEPHGGDNRYNGRSNTPRPFI